MTINIPLMRKENEITPCRCEIIKTIELSHQDFESFRNNLLSDYSFIKENAAEMGVGTDGAYYVIMVLDKDSDDGILVESEGSSYARYSAFLPNARNIAIQMQYPSLNALADEMRWTVDKYTRKAIDGQIDCQYSIDLNAIERQFRHSGFSEKLFADMLLDRPEIEHAETDDGYCVVTIAEPYLHQDDEQSLCNLTSEEVEIMCAKHILWLHDAGGEQADFSNCLIKDLNLSGKNLINAVFDGAKFVDTDLSKAELCFALFNGTRFQNCDLSDVIAEESELKNAECIACNFDGGVFTHSDFTGAKFYDCTMKNGGLQYCCLDKTDFEDMNLGSVNMSNCSYDKQEWSAEALGENISM